MTEAKQLKYPEKPNHVTSVLWFYEEPKGLFVCVREDEHTNALVAFLPWRKIEAAVDRHRAIKAAKEKP